MTPCSLWIKARVTAVENTHDWAKVFFSNLRYLISQSEILVNHLDPGFTSARCIREAGF